MGIYRRHVLPRIVDKVCARADFTDSRRAALAGVSGRVVEIGFGSGHNLAHYPAGVDRIIAVEPSPVARRLAAGRIASAGIPVQFVDLAGDHLPLPDASADAVVSTFTLCTIPDLPAALGEIRRILRPGAALHFAEHGLSPEPRIARRQHRLTPIQKRLAGGCHLDRPIAALIAANGFAIESLDNYCLNGHQLAGYVYRGIARAA